MHVRGFPNLFIFSIVQSGFSVNFPHMLDEQARHLAYILDHAQENDIKVIEASQEAEDAWVQAMLDAAINRLDFLESCTPGYYNNEGHPNAAGLPRRSVRRRLDRLRGRCGRPGARPGSWRASSSPCDGSLMEIHTLAPCPPRGSRA